MNITTISGPSDQAASGQASAQNVARKTAQSSADGTSGLEAWAAKNAYDPMDDREALQEAEDRLRTALQAVGVRLRFHVDQSTDKLQVEIVDPDSGKTVQKLPPDNLLKLAKSLQETSRGLLDRLY
ncbi:flagellar protein FlaG protein [Desulfovibrio sp. X2]|uniref:flagellar protein FlaG n=1 Tax=Desulfovibrio sp. X2 TaxID=941449 RepID=UPI000358CAA1|nr:flagellar protein FlaG [Desulfovibrio sp. X2]EPR43885.1 flagellar protein FlaG protein [Desulfovibrio sp. X2]